MINNEILDLIQRALDDEVNSEERKKLDSLMAENNEVKHLYLSMRRMVAQLDRMEEVEPRPFLESRIKAAVRDQAAAARRVSFTDRLTLMAGSLFTPKIPITFAAGLAAGLLIFVVAGPYFGGGNSFDPAHMSGTMLKETAADSGGFASTVSLDQGDITFRSYEKDGSRFVDIDIQAETDYTIELDFSSNSLIFTGIDGLNDNTTEFSQSGGVCRIVGNVHDLLTLSFGPRSGSGGRIDYTVSTATQTCTGVIGDH